MTIRALQHGDCEILSTFFLANDRTEITDHFHPFPLTSETAHRLVHNPTRDLYYIALEHDYILGFCMLRGWDEGYAIPSFGVLVDYRHLGRRLGKQLTEFAIAKARSMDCPAVRLSVCENNDRALRLYASLDFREVARETAKEFSTGNAKIVMLKDLKNV